MNFDKLMAVFNDKYYGQHHIVKNTWLVLEPLFDYKSGKYFLRDSKTLANIRTFNTKESVIKFILEDLKND